MSSARLVRSFVSDTPEYHQSFRVFLEHTDQKDKAFAWLAREVDRLARRDVMIDAGAGTGKLTAWFTSRFGSLVAVEPSPSLVGELRRNCPNATVLPVRITEAAPPAADFVLCSHVFYYISHDDWESNASRLISWLRPGGVLAISLQNPNTDCMKMVDHFIGRRCDLRDLAELRGVPDRCDLDVRVETVAASIVAPSLAIACAVAEFILNVLPMSGSPAWEELEHYVETHFHTPGGGYRLSCDQDFLRVARRA